MKKNMLPNGNDLYISSLKKSFDNFKKEEGYDIYLKILRDLGKE